MHGVSSLVIINIVVSYYNKYFYSKKFTVPIKSQMATRYNTPPVDGLGSIDRQKSNSRQLNKSIYYSLITVRPVPPFPPPRVLQI